MAPKVDLVNVKVSVNGKEQTIKMEKGTSFENKGGIFTAGETNSVLKMTNYQLQTFKAMANNYAEEGENGIVLSKKDIQVAQQKYRNGGFVKDMSEFLPEGYKIERPKLTSAENMVQAYVTNGKDSQSATLKFSFVDKKNNKTEQSETTVREKDLAKIKINVDGKVYDVKVESNLIFQDYIIQSNGKLAKIQSSWGGPSTANYYVSPEIGNGRWTYFKEFIKDSLIKMNRLEFEMFKSVANNRIEKNSEIILTNEDLNIAQNLHANKELEKDIKADLPNQFKSYDFSNSSACHDFVHISAEFKKDEGYGHQRLRIYNGISNYFEEDYDWLNDENIVAASWDGENCSDWPVEYYKKVESIDGKIRLEGSEGTKIIKYLDENNNMITEVQQDNITYKVDNNDNIFDYKDCTK